MSSPDEEALEDDFVSLLIMPSVETELLDIAVAGDNEKCGAAVKNSCRIMLCLIAVDFQRCVAADKAFWKLAALAIYLMPCC